MSLKRKSAISVLAITMLAAIVGMSLTFSAFTSTTENNANTFKAGTVVLTDNDAGSTLFSMTQMQPGSAQAKCLTVAYTGSLDSLVRLYGTTTSTPGKDLSPYLNVTIKRGSFSGATPADQDCTGFTAASTLYDGTLAAYPATYAAGVQDSTTFATDDTAVYQVSVSLQDNDLAQDKDATTKLTFEARDKVVTAP
jgi:hypothetical protein